MRVTATALDTGFVVFTDLVGFTQLTAERGDEFALTLLEHQDRIVRDALPDGARVVKELGDGMLLWFPDGLPALAVCLELQAEFCAASTEDAPLWVRMGMHWGRPRRRGEDLVGHDVNLAARIVDVAGPGEVLVSEPALARLGAPGSSGSASSVSLPADAAIAGGVSFEELGPVFVKGVADPVRLFRAVATC